MRTKLLVLAIASALSFDVSADNHLLSQLDSVIAERPRITATKEHKLNEMRKTIEMASSDSERLKLYEEMFKEYNTYRFDSALVYIQKCLQLSKSMDNTSSYQHAVIQQALLNARGGFYGQAQIGLNSLNLDDLPDHLKYEYHIACFWLYLYVGEYSEDREAKRDYRKKMNNNLIDALKYVRENTPNWYYLTGERLVIVEGNNKEAISYYMNVVNMDPQNSKLYASAAYALARYYKDTNDKKNYEEWLVKAAISDMITPLKENLALQELAIYLFEQNAGNVERATRYIYCSMEDAQFFNNRLRIIEISEKFPNILSAYTNHITEQKSRILYGLIALGTLMILILFALVFIKKQNTQLHKRRTELQAMNNQLHQQHEEVREKNSLLEEQQHQLSLLNEQLIDTNFKREGLAKIYIDLCAKYIDKLKKYQTLVQRKIKANQVNELLSTMSSSRISEEDAAIFLGKFDKAFLNLYPTFVQELNTLLTTEQQIAVKQGDALTTELRIYALIRLGVKESAEIADLLFYSPQTIYNYRSSLKNRAINKETFDEDVQKLCSVIRK